MRDEVKGEFQLDAVTSKSFDEKMYTSYVWGTKFARYEYWRTFCLN